MTKLNLIPLQKERPPIGKHSAVIADVYYATEKNTNGEMIKYVKVAFQLSLTDSSGKRFEMVKGYSLNPKRTKMAFTEWESGLNRKYTDAELREFDFELELLNKAVTVEIEHAVREGKPIAIVKGLSPASDTAIAVEPGYIRKTETTE